ncbi:sensor histidine kinase [Granulicoccus sp. GXG6511]|uniref:sensor histidine kinase n=1 Tax=Granulicoccus sp. GXG6511 TaxID=3381351 RepID=UPI003D7F070A
MRHSVRTRVVDGAIAALLLCLALVEVLSAHGIIDGLVADPAATRGALSLDLALAALTILPVAARRAQPAAVPVAVFGLQIIVNLAVAHHFPFFGGMISLGLLTYTLGRHAPARAARWGWVGPVGWAATFPVHTVSAREPASLVYAGILLSLPWVVGLVIRRLAAQRDALDNALSQLTQLEAARQEAALLSQRAQIAREMHDVLAHGVSVMVVQAGAARLGVPKDSPAHEQLLAVEQTGRRVLGELRRTVGLLRSGGADEGIQPAPGLRDLPDLVDSMRAAGLTAAFTPSPIGRVDAPRELVAYRVVQEALTNCVRHAGPTTVTVDVTDEGDSLWVRIADEGGRPSAPAEGGGFGLAGLRERVELYGGTLRAGPHGRGFEVKAVIPWEAPR